MRTDVRYRVEVTGAEIRLLVLAHTAVGCTGIDLASGAFVRAVHPATDEPLRTLDVVSAEIGEPLDPPEFAQPEAVQLASPPRKVGNLGIRRAERYLQAVQHPPQSPLLGFSGPAVPYWTRAGDRPSLSVLTAEVGPQVRWAASGFECRFSWQGQLHQLPLGDDALEATLRRLERPRCSGRELARLLGYRPRRLLVVLTPPIDGYCFKQVAALLPGGRHAGKT
ncbi:MAG: hypothetical protein ACRD0Q_09990 [Acidimicrobiales bacterium]